MASWCLALPASQALKVQLCEHWAVRAQAHMWLVAVIITETFESTHPGS